MRLITVRYLFFFLGSFHHIIHVRILVNSNLSLINIILFRIFTQIVIIMLKGDYSMSVSKSRPGTVELAHVLVLWKVIICQRVN
jgi:hypothetical protein